MGGDSRMLRCGQVEDRGVVSERTGVARGRTGVARWRTG